MSSSSWKYLPSLILLPVALVAVGCSSGKNNSSTGPSATTPAPGPGGAGEGGSSSHIKQVMGKLTKGPQALQGKLKQELAASPTPWDTIQPQAKEYADEAATLSKDAPPKGSAESWQKETAAFTALADELNRAAQAKDFDTVKAAHDKLDKSCKSCHDAHRGRGPRG